MQGVCGDFMKNTVLSKEDIRDICLSLSMLFRSGVGFGDGFSLMSEDEPKGKIKELLQEMADMADEGKGAADVFRETGVFPKYVIGLIEAGERTGRLEEAFSSLADYYDSRIRLENHIRSALLYPMVLLIIMILVIGVLLVKVMPVFDGVYRQLGSGLTGMAGGLLELGVILDKCMPAVLLILSALIIFTAVFALVPKFRGWLGLKWNKSQGSKGVTGELNAAKTAQVISMGLRSGLPFEEIFELAGELMADVPEIEMKCRKCADELSQGGSLSDTIKKYDILPLAECRILEVALRGGMADEAIFDIAKRLMTESEEAFETKISRVEPALVIVTSFMVGAILLSVILPLVNIMASIG